MSIPEAAYLVLQSGAVAQSGQTCVLEMGKAVRIMELACSLIERAGLRPEVDIQIQITGLKPGEKLAEELVASRKAVQPTSWEKILLDRPDEINAEQLGRGLKALEECLKKFDRVRLIEVLQQLVPTYRPQGKC
jgi:FlaA1/EpsC-like NDP-sugar epimerase